MLFVWSWTTFEFSEAHFTLRPTGNGNIFSIIWMLSNQGPSRVSTEWYIEGLMALAQRLELLREYYKSLRNAAWPKVSHSTNLKCNGFAMPGLGFLLAGWPPSPCFCWRSLSCLGLNPEPLAIWNSLVNVRGVVKAAANSHDCVRPWANFLRSVNSHFVI